MSDLDRMADAMVEPLRCLSGEDLARAMGDVVRRHAEHLIELGPVRVLALDPCPRCMGRVIASEMEAKCASGCGWSYTRFAEPEPIASRRADP